MSRPYTFDRVIRIVIAALILLIIYVLLRRLSGVLIPFFVAWLAAYLLYPIVCFFQYKCRLRSRALSIIVTLTSVVGLLVTVCSLLISPLVGELEQVQTIIVTYLQSDEQIAELQQVVQRFFEDNINVRTLQKYITMADFTSVVREAVPSLLSFLSGSINALLGFIASLIAVMYMFFILMDYENMNRGFLHIFPLSRRHFIRGMLHDVERGMNSYFRGQALVALCVGILFATGFVIIDFPMAIALGLFIGLLNLVPYLQVIGLLPTILLAFLKSYDTGQNFWLIMLGAILVFVIVQSIQDWILVPRIMGHVTGMNAAVILLSLSVWGSLLGFIGLIIALPLTSLITSYYRRYILHERDRQVPDDKGANN